jgi:hypothetical protein
MACFTVPGSTSVLAVAVALCGCVGSINQGGAPPGGTGSAPPTAGVGAPPPAGAPAPSAASAEVPAGMRRLTATEYINTVHDLLGPTIKVGAGDLDRDDPSVVFGAVGGYRIATAPGGVVKYQDLAFAIADQIFANPGLVQSTIGCDTHQPACGATFVKAFGRRAFRRPLSDAEVARYTRVIDDVGKTFGGDPVAGFRYVLAALLQSPSFLYLPELGEVDPATRTLRFTSFEMAARLSYLLQDTMPDAELAAAADRNELVTPQGLRKQVDRLLAAPATRPSLGGFFAELLGVNQLDQLDKDLTVYPQATPDLVASMAAEARHLIDDNAIARRNAVLDLLDTHTTYLDAGLAKLYGLPAPAAGQPSTLPPQRAGILTTAAWLATQAKPYSSSPTYRGIWIREKLLCQTVPSPPPGVMNDLPNPAQATGPARTTRQTLEAHRKDPACATCHSFFDPIGVAFEHFDGIGAYRDTDQGLPIDAGGDLDGKAYGSLADLVGLLKADPRVPDCLVRQAFRYVSGHEKLPSEDGVVKALAPGFRTKPDYLDLLVAMVTSDWFRYPAAPL